MIKSRWAFSQIIGIVVISASLWLLLAARGKGRSVPTFVITETSMFTSVDPLDGDASQNLPVARMLYATPLEILSNNTLGSRVLSSFTYDKESKTIKWIAKSDPTYSDGSKITADDIAFSVARMAYERPRFPLLKLIKGLTSWKSQANALASFPEGIRVHGNEIQIEFTEDYPHPMFRFCLELFGIVPRSAVDVSTNRLKPGHTPTSGYYTLRDQKSSELFFSKRNDVDLIQGKHYEPVIRFVYADALKALDDNSLHNDETVIMSSEARLTNEQIQKYENAFTVGYTPAAWFTILQFNPNVAPFQNATCRRMFAEVFRTNASKLTSQPIEGSVFTKLVSGYKTHQAMEAEAKSHDTANALAECSTAFKGSVLNCGFEKSTPDMFGQAVILTANQLGMKLNHVDFADRKQQMDAFINGDLGLTYARTGFWALDPTGDIQMLFTPNLHDGLKFFWNDKPLQSMLNTIVKDGKVNEADVDAINSYLYTDAKFNVYSHIRRFYASKNSALVRHLADGITSPSPWHLFGEKK